VNAPAGALDPFASALSDASEKAYMVLALLEYGYQPHRREVREARAEVEAEAPELVEEFTAEVERLSSEVERLSPGQLRGTRRQLVTDAVRFLRLERLLSPVSGPWLAREPRHRRLPRRRRRASGARPGSDDDDPEVGSPEAAA
jgi:hypothetical protein